LPRVEAVAVLHRDDQGLLTMAYNPRGQVTPEQWTRASAVLYRRWIAAHTAEQTRGRMPAVVFEPGLDVTLVPFSRGDSLLGAILLVGEDGRRVDETTILGVSLGSLGVVMSQALANVVLRHRLRATVTRTEHEHALSRAAKAFGRDLHDGPLQDLAVITMALDRVVAGQEASGSDMSEGEYAREMADRAIERLRQQISGLRTSAPAQVASSMTAPLRAVVAEAKPRPGEAALEVDIADVSGVQLSPEIEHALVGITREALHNVRKHAGAERVRLEVHQVGSEVELIINDDGVGFDGASRPGHFGLEQIRELAEETGGRIEIGSQAGQGTEVRARIPIQTANS
ncbi:MAG: sensor histidine kinase, partial [Thermomicrobiales bacterium]